MDFDPQTWAKEIEERRAREFPNMGDPTPVTRLFGNFRDDEISNLKLEFIRLRDDWRENSGHFSSIRERTAHPSYQAIIALGPDVVPLLIKDLMIEPLPWFPALRQLTGVNPVPYEHRGRVQLMAEDWIAWAKENGVIPADLTVADLLGPLADYL